MPLLRHAMSSLFAHCWWYSETKIHYFSIRIPLCGTFPELFLPTRPRLPGLRCFPGVARFLSVHFRLPPDSCSVRFQSICIPALVFFLSPLRFIRTVTRPPPPPAHPNRQNYNTPYGLKNPRFCLPCRFFNYLCRYRHWGSGPLPGQELRKFFTTGNRHSASAEAHALAW